ncbi:MAG: ABC transporter permease [Lewinellaceae bacterium]|nr:ABC transporter permease [Saprospiraceae bacterium]MCB9330511.1 ABC transporter permease [Lewinellaceae bacterium]
MLRNFITIAVRNLRHYRSYTLINIAGLALGITCGLLIFLLIRFHLSVDTYHAQAKRIYRVVTDLHIGDDNINMGGVPYPFGKALRLDFPEIQSVALTRFESNNLITTIPDAADQPRKKFMLEREMAFVEPEFFQTFDYTWLKGKPSALKAPFEAVITAPLAEKFFGTADPIGKTIRLENQHDFRISGVLAKPAANSEFHKTALFLSYASYLAINNPDIMAEWGSISGNHQCFVVLPEGLQPKQIEQGFPAFEKKYHEKSDEWSYKLQPLKDMHFNPDYGGDVPKTMLFALAIVGLFLIGTACINFINLATAQALNRSREVGVRKVLGSSRWQLFNQFLLETGLITLAALVVSILLVSWALPFVNDLTHSELTVNLYSDAGLLLFLLVMLFGVTLLAGAYPAFILAGFKPVQAIKGKINTQTLGGYSLRRGLVVTQFVICQIMIIAAIVISGQMDYLKNASLGFNKDAIVMLPVPNPEKSNMEALRQQLLRVPGVQQLSFACDAPAGDSQNSANCRFDTRQEDEPWYINTRPCDEAFLSTFGIELVAGRNLQPGDTIREYLINEAAVEKLGLKSPEEALGKSFAIWGKEAPIVGVIRNFHNRSLRETVEPTVLMTSRERYAACGVKIDLSNTPHILAAVDRIWNDVYPDAFYSYAFLDDKIARFYEIEHALLSMTKGFCAIALFIGCLGLFGLVSFMTARKRKEIGVRKVLGATVAQILQLFGKEFFRLILIAFVLAAPLGWLAMSAWLQDYPYRIPLGAGVFLATIGATCLVALLTVGAQSLKAARSNPANSLRSE